MTSRATVTFHTSQEVKARLDRLATATRRSKSYLTNEAVQRYLADEEAFITAVEEGIAQADAGSFIAHDDAATYLRSLAAGETPTEPEPRDP